MPDETVSDGRSKAFTVTATDQFVEHRCPCRVVGEVGNLRVVASRPIAAGERIAVERPLTLTVAHGARERVCAVCLERVSSGALPHTCEVCRAVSYCSPHCAAVAAHRHASIECGSLRSALADPDVDEDTVDLVAQAVRILADRAAGRTVQVGPAGSLGYAAYAERLVGVVPTTEEARGFIDRAVRATLRAVPAAARVDAAELRDLCQRHQCNLYGVTGEAGEDVASASFVGHLHLFNHSCCPNVVFDSSRRLFAAEERQAASRSAREQTEVESGEEEEEEAAAVGAAEPSFALVALQAVEEGAELCISYTSTAEGPTQRQQHLLEYYAFECACPRCTCDDLDAELTYGELLDARRCARVDECGSGLAVPPHPGSTLRRCVHCGGEWEEEEEEA